MASMTTVPKMTSLTGKNVRGAGGGRRGAWDHSRLLAPRPLSLVPPQAFTLVELLVVLGIIGLLVAASVPALTSYARQARLKAATREVVGLLSLARSSAISTRGTKTVLVDPDHHELTMEATSDQPEPRVIRLSSSVDVTVQTSGQDAPAEGVSRLVFQPSGALAGRSVSVVLSNGARQQTVQVTATTGAIIVQ